MKEIKYTNDGKKVTVVGKLNSQESIVQEIFITNGNEIPSGENFVVKSLHDSPVISWASYEERRHEELKKELKVKNEELEKQITIARKKVETHSIATKVKLEELNLSEEAFKFLEHYLTHEIIYYVTGRWGEIKIKKFEEEESSFGYMKLLSLFGNSKGDLIWNLNRYSNGSGGYEKVYPCISYDEALMKVQELLNERIEDHGVNKDLIKSARKYNLIIPIEKIEEFKKEQEEYILKQIEELKNKITEKENEIKELSDI